MSRRREETERSLVLPRRPVDYDIGYGKPPVKTKFRPGRSGNPLGRPKGAKRSKLPALNEERLKAIVAEEAYRSITINDANGRIDISMAQAVVRSLAVNAAKGNQRSQRLFTELLISVERDNKRLYDEWLQTAIEYKVEWERELDRRQRLGIKEPDPIPHPDHVIIDMQTGSVRITGPMTKEEKLALNDLRARKLESIHEIGELQQLLQSEPDHPHRAQIEEEIAHKERVRNVLSKVIPD
jgi:hypothetical protein